MRMMTPLIIGTVLATSLTVTAAAKPHLRDVTSINDGLLAVGIADKIRKSCPTINARLVRALRYMNALENKAETLGYTSSEIKAYVKNDAEKAKMRARGEAYLASHGVVKTDPETYCAQGRVEIANKSQIGSLLRAK